MRRNFGERLANPNSQGPVLTVAAVARELDVPTATAYRWVREGKIVGVKLGTKGFWRVERTELDSYLEGNASPSQTNLSHP